MRRLSSFPDLHVPVDGASAPVPPPPPRRHTVHPDTHLQLHHLRVDAATRETHHHRHLRRPRPPGRTARWLAATLRRLAARLEGQPARHPRRA